MVRKVTEIAVDKSRIWDSTDSIVNSTENLWDYKRTAEFIGVAPATIYNWVYQRRIPYLKINNDLLRFDPDEIREWILKNRNGTEDNSHCPPAVDGD